MLLLKKCAIFSMMIALCLSLVACGSEEQEYGSVPSQGGKPILPGVSQVPTSPNDFTTAYVTVFKETAIIAAYPVEIWENQEPECAPRELSFGGSILCGCDHETEYPITRVLIVDRVVPRSMAGWFRNMMHLKEIKGVEKVQTYSVTDMSYLFAGCGRLAELYIDNWDVSSVTDMTGIFEGCDALSVRPCWYEQEKNDSLD